MKKVYRIVTESELHGIKRNGFLGQSKLDVESGFIHLSFMEHVLGTANLYFTREQVPHLVEIDAASLGQALRYENVPTRNNQLFPHYYGTRIMRASICRIIVFEHSVKSGFCLDL